MKTTDLDLCELKTEQLLNCLPENLVILKDSGLWTISNDDNTELFRQNINESFKKLIIRAIIFFHRNENYRESIAIDVCLCSTDANYYL